MADAQKEQVQAPQEQDPVLQAKTRAAQRIKALFHKEKEATMNDERAVETFLKIKTQEKKGFSKEKQLKAMQDRVWYIAPRPTIEKMLAQKQAA
jgi:hypothetical protein